jgi:hypothetical protein
MPIIINIIILGTIKLTDIYLLRVLQDHYDLGADDSSRTCYQKSKNMLEINHTSVSGHTRLEEKREAVRVMEKPSDGLHEKQ